MIKDDFTKFNFKLGQLVAVKSFPEYVFSPTQHLQFKAYMQNVPVMIIYEIAYVPKLEKKFDPETGKQNVSNIKYHCYWFSRKDYLFHSAWFYQEELQEMPENLKVISTVKELKIENFSEFPIGEEVEYKTSKIEERKYQERNEYNISVVKKDNNEDFFRLDHTKRFLRLIDFVPPKMSVKSIIMEKTPKSYDSKTGDCTNEKSSILVKCVWFNNNSNKYSEELIPIEALTSNFN